MKEIEIKFKLSRNKFYKLKKEILKKTGLVYKQIFEKNVIFDDNEGNLFKQGKLLRMRLEILSKKTKRYILTFKDVDKGEKYFKEREEIDILLDSSSVKSAFLILRRLGFKVVLIFEKKRYDLNYKNLLISLSQLPILGYYLEIEGDKKEILKLIKLLNLKIEDSIKKSFVELLSRYQNKLILFSK